MAIDVPQRGDLPFPRSLPEFQRLFPDEAVCTAYLECARWNGGFTCLHWGRWVSRITHSTISSRCV